LSPAEVLLSNEDTSALLKVMSHVAMIDGSIRKKKIHILEELAKIIRSDCWMWTIIPPIQPGDKTAALDFLHGGFEQDRLAAYLEASEHRQMEKVHAPFIRKVIDKQEQVTQLREEFDPRGQFPEMSVFKLWQKADISPMLLSARVLEDGAISMAGFYRSRKSKPFKRREARVVQSLLKEVDWFHLGNPEAIRKKKNLHLTPRERTVLNLLIDGATRKMIAFHLNLTENTVAGYIKDVYRIYGVHSQAELLKYFRDNN
jgi:DNA-binding CsgD family transcriptional regulator